MKRRYVSGRDPARAIAIADLRAMALRRLPGFVAEYLEGGAEGEKTLAANLAAMQACTLMPRVLRDVAQVSTAGTVLGLPAALPLIVAPTGYAGIFWPEGDIALATAAAGAGIPFCQSIMSNAALEQVRARSGCRHWMQIYPFGPAVLEGIVDAATKAGTEALVFTVDGPVLGNREWDRRNYARPFVLNTRSFFDMLAHPAWFARGPLRGLPGFPNIEANAPPGTKGTAATARWAVKALDAASGWADFADLRSRWPGRLVIKGLLSPEDARRAVELGADAVVVSNHGGRQLDGAPASLVALPAVVDSIAGRAEVYMDSGIRRGTDIARAIALGADAVMTGRATLYGLAAAGQPGAARAIAILQEELARTMALLGVSNLGQLGSDVLFPANPHCQATAFSERCPT